MKTRLKKLFFILLAISLPCFVLFCVFELAVRLFLPDIIKYPQGLFVEAQSPQYYKFAPGFKGRIKQSDYDIRVEINEDGFRDYASARFSVDGDADGLKNDSANTSTSPLLQPQPRQKKIIGLGDSFAFGDGVELEESFYALLEAQLNHQDPHQNPQQKVRIIKTGCHGYNTEQELEVLKKLLLAGEKADIAMLAFYINDLSDIGQVRKVEGGHLVASKQKGYLSGTKAFVLRHSRLCRLAYNHVVRNMVLLSWLQKSGLLAAHDRSYNHSNKFLVDAPEKVTQQWQEQKRLLERMQKLCKESGVQLQLFYIPIQYQVDEDLWGAMKKSLSLLEDDYDLNLPNRLLGQYCSELEIDYLDLTPVIRNNSGASYYFPHDPHFNVAGHAVSANCLVPFVKPYMNP
ncbi:MAG: SGNH/GDSL hydrolase family protein [Planctomycetes bacterium]|nr:SGNH/GDSL hydrolase family protein [Planctomycetota bacterium]